MELPKGEKYLSIKIVGHDWINVFLNKKKEKSNQPDFKADGVAIWVKTKEEKEMVKQPL